MIYTIQPSQYLDEISRRGIVVVLLHVDDTLYRRSLLALEKAEHRFSGHAFRFCSCLIVDGQAATEVQAIKFPQFRFFLHGSERASHVGIMGENEIAQEIYTILESFNGK